MIYHVIKDKIKIEYYLSRFVIQLVLFLSRLLSLIKTRYWFTKLELVDIIWVLKKIKYLIKLFILIIVIYIDYNTALDIIKQISLITSLIDKLNFKLMRIFNYIQRFDLNIRHKLNKNYIISNILSRLFNLNKINNNSNNDKKLNVLYTIILMKININSCSRLLYNYKINST